MSLLKEAKYRVPGGGWRPGNDGWCVKTGSSFFFATEKQKAANKRVVSLLFSGVYGKIYSHLGTGNNYYISLKNPLIWGEISLKG